MPTDSLPDFGGLSMEELPEIVNSIESARVNPLIQGYILILNNLVSKYPKLPVDARCFG
jgi:hypothetical protein